MKREERGGRRRQRTEDEKGRKDRRLEIKKIEERGIGDESRGERRGEAFTTAHLMKQPLRGTRRTAQKREERGSKGEGIRCEVRW